MSNAILDTILQSAIRTGSGIVKDIITAQLGPTIGGLAGSVIDTVAENMGVTPAEIPSQLPADVDQAVRATDDDPAILKLYLEQQKTTADLLKAEMEKSESLWTWAWRPAWMWFLMFLWAWNVVLATMIAGITGAVLTIAPWD
ncbi:MAG: hypothetical protein ACTHLK_22020, partial [Brucella intermedia]